jgi:hypothetical protein
MADGCGCETGLNSAFGVCATGQAGIGVTAPDLRYIESCYKVAMDDVLALRNGPRTIGDIMGMLLGQKTLLDTSDYIADLTAQAHALGFKQKGHIDLSADLTRMATATTPQGRAECLLDFIVTNLDHAHQQITEVRKTHGAGHGTHADLAATNATDTADNLAKFLANLSPSANQGCTTITSLCERLRKLRDDCVVLHGFPSGQHAGAAPSAP